MLVLVMVTNITTNAYSLNFFTCQYLPMANFVIVLISKSALILESGLISSQMASNAI